MVITFAVIKILSNLKLIIKVKIISCKMTNSFKNNEFKGNNSSQDVILLHEKLTENSLGNHGLHSL